MEDQYKAQYAATEITKAATAVAGWMGEYDFSAVLKIMHTRNEAYLIVACPTYKVMAAVPKSLKMARIQSSIKTFIGDRGTEHLLIIVTPEMFTIFTRTKRHCVGP